MCSMLCQLLLWDDDWMSKTLDTFLFPIRAKSLCYWKFALCDTTLGHWRLIVWKKWWFLTPLYLTVFLEQQTLHLSYTNKSNASYFRFKTHQVFSRLRTYTKSSFWTYKNDYSRSEQPTVMKVYNQLNENEHKSY